MKTLSQLEKEIDEIKKRNSVVEENKAWETSLTRKTILILFTYLSVGLYLKAINVKNPWLNAIVPSLGFLLSTLTMPYIKKIWTKYLYKKTIGQVIRT
ncbi:MAG: hypothetical protein ACOYUB_03575 [Patescibacteria group bacterium]